ncbi:MAG: glycosyltransferase family 4 protein [Promethearchaeota archaeon]
MENKLIKVCFVQSFAYSVFNPKSSAKIGGAEVDLYNISTELAKDRRFKVYFIVADFGQKDIEVYNNVKVIKSHCFKKTTTNYLKAILLFFRKLRQVNADIYLTANRSKFVFFTSLYCKIFRKIHIHRTEHINQVEKSLLVKDIGRRSMRSLFFLLGFMNVDHIIVQNNVYQEKLKRNFGYPSTVIKNSYRIPAKANYQREFVLWVARCVAWKRPEIFIDLAQAFPKEKFIMIAPISFEPDFFEKTKLKAEDVKNLQFIPGVPFSEIDQYYKNAKVFVNTSESEGFPNSFNQSMNYSTPILSLNINPDNFLETYNVGLCANGNFNSLKENLNKLLQDKELWNHYSTNAYNYVFNEMNIEKAIKVWKFIFNYFYKKRL